MPAWALNSRRKIGASPLSAGFFFGAAATASGGLDASWSFAWGFFTAAVGAAGGSGATGATSAAAGSLAAAGGITTQQEIDTLDRHGVDAVVGMAVYTGKLQIPSNP